MKKYKEPNLRVNICWEVGDEKKCVTLSKEEAYATKNWVEENDGMVYWFSPVTQRSFARPIFKARNSSAL